MELKKQIQYIICPECKGSGRSKHVDCQNCSGLGMGTFFYDRFLHVGLRFSKGAIRLRELKKKVNTTINFVAFVVGICGIIALGWWFYNTNTLQVDDAYAFWQYKNPLILFFWLSALADMFIIYRISEEENQKFKIKKIKTKEDVVMPNNWQELKKYKKKLDVSSGFDIKTLKIIERAILAACEAGHSRVSTLHLFLSLLDDENVNAFFVRLNVDREKLINKINKQLLNAFASSQEASSLYLSNEIKEMMIEAYIEAYELGQIKVKSLDFIIPIINKDKALAEVLYDLEVDMDKIRNMLSWFRVNEKIIENYKRYQKLARYKPSSNMNRSYTSVATPALDHYGVDLTVAAKFGRLDMCVTRNKEIEEIFQLFESGRAGVLLVGSPGVGKKTIVHGIAQLMVEEEVPKIFKDKRLVEINIARLVGGASAEQAEQRMLVVLDEVARSGNIMLFIDNIENIVGITSGGEESLELSEVLANAVSNGSIYCIASATKANFTNYIEGRPIAQAMEKIKIDEPEKNQAIQIIESKIGFFEAKYKVFFSYDAIEKAIDLTNKYIHDKFLPKKAVDILERIATKVAQSRGERSMVSKDDVSQVVSEITNIPVTKVGANEGKELLKLEEKIHEKMINQKEAVSMVAASLRRARAEVREGGRPIANFLFLGPTGVGKTELAKTVTEVFFGDSKYMVRLDMSEYQHQDSIKKMIGDSSGVHGYLTEAVRKQPFSLVLLDEFEKAHPEILNLFLQVMDDGRLTDAQGRTIDFTNSIIVATSNAGSLYIQKKVNEGVEVEKIKQALINEELNKTMKPELINRFDGVIVFTPLSEDDVAKIARLMLKKTEKLLAGKGVHLKVSDEGVRKIAREGYDPKFGARPLRRVLQRKVDDIIANKILAGNLDRRDTVIINDHAGIEVEKGREL